MTKKKAAQLELFATRGQIHALGVMGYNDPLWSKAIKIPLLSGKTLTVNLITIRALARWRLLPLKKNAARISPDSSASADGAKS